MRISFKLNTDGAGRTAGGEMRDLYIDLPKGMAGDPFAVPRCPRQDFEGGSPHCSPNTQVGFVHATIPGLGQPSGPIYNMIPPPGVAAQLGFSASGLNALQNISLSQTDDRLRPALLDQRHPARGHGAERDDLGRPRRLQPRLQTRPQRRRQRRRTERKRSA